MGGSDARVRLAVAGHYESLQDAEITGIAWECLRRNADYRRDYQAMIANSLHGQMTAEFRRRWGI
ncbi:transcriptional regulator domain-containing protein [Bradyrhizobium sp. USDA 3315]